MKTYIFDNGGKTFDRYTIIAADGEVYGSSCNPFHPQGFGQYCGHVIELREPEYNKMFLNKDRQWRHDAVIRYKRQFVNEARRNPEWMGREVSIDQLPADVQQYVKQVNS